MESSAGPDAAAAGGERSSSGRGRIPPPSGRWEVKGTAVRAGLHEAGIMVRSRSVAIAANCSVSHLPDGSRHMNAHTV